MFLRALVGLFLAAAVPYGAARTEPSEPGAFGVGSYQLTFSATRKNSGRPAEKFQREIPDLGPATLTLEPAATSNASGMEVDVQLLREKNQFDPPDVLATLAWPQRGPLRLDYDFAVEGKYIVVVNARDANGVPNRGQYVFFVIQTEESHPLLVGVFCLACVGAAVAIWRGRSRSNARGTRGI